MARYVIADASLGYGWSHIFSEIDKDTDRPVERERMTSFVYDTEELRILHLDVEGRGTRNADYPDLIESLEQNLDMEPASVLGLVSSDELPEFLADTLPTPY